MVHEENEKAVERLSLAFLNRVAECGMYAHVTILNPTFDSRRIEYAHKDYLQASKRVFNGDSNF